MADDQTAFDRDYPWLDPDGDCSNCDGTGEVAWFNAPDPGAQAETSPGYTSCPRCGGTGYVGARPGESSGDYLVMPELPELGEDE